MMAICSPDVTAGCANAFPVPRHHHHHRPRFRSENASGLGIRVLAEAIEKEGASTGRL
jgi:hypothetical protein